MMMDKQQSHQIEVMMGIFLYLLVIRIIYYYYYSYQPLYYNA